MTHATSSSRPNLLENKDVWNYTLNLLPVDELSETAKVNKLFLEITDTIRLKLINENRYSLEAVGLSEYERLGPRIKNLYFSSSLLKLMQIIPNFTGLKTLCLLDISINKAALEIFVQFHQLEQLETLIIVESKYLNKNDLTPINASPLLTKPENLLTKPKNIILYTDKYAYTRTSTLDYAEDSIEFEKEWLKLGALQRPVDYKFWKKHIIYCKERPTKTKLEEMKSYLELARPGMQEARNFDTFLKEQFASMSKLSCEVQADRKTIKVICGNTEKEWDKENFLLQIPQLKDNYKSGVLKLSELYPKITEEEIAFFITYMLDPLPYYYRKFLEEELINTYNFAIKLGIPRMELLIAHEIMQRLLKQTWENEILLDPLRTYGGIGEVICKYYPK